MNADEAARRATRAAESLHQGFYPGDEARGPREGVHPEAVQAVDSILRLLAGAEDAFAPGIGKPDLDAGARFVRDALDVLERELPAWILDGVHELVVARADAQRDLDAIVDARLQPLA